LEDRTDAMTPSAQPQVLILGGTTEGAASAGRRGCRGWTGSVF